MWVIESLLGVTVDINVLFRAVLQDDSVQYPIANELLRQADTISLPCLCELVWILKRMAKFLSQNRPNNT